MKLCRNRELACNRRDFLQRTAAGFGWLALAALHAQWTRAESGDRRQGPLAPKDPHFAPRAKRVIFLFMEGGPTHLDTFDWKPELAKAGGRYLAPQFSFKPAGKSGLMISEVFPHLARHADELCLLQGMQTNNNGHMQSIVLLHTGSINFVRPSLGSWIVYGLGSLAEDLPGFVTVNPISNLGGAQNYGSAFLPATFQGTRLLAGQGAVPNIANHNLAAGDQPRQLAFLQDANRRLLAHDPANPELIGLIESYELAFKMQTSVPETLDLGREPPRIRELYGLNEPASQSFGTQCLMARRLAEKGVRFIQLTSNGWDHHNNIRTALAGRAAAIDKPIAGLIEDLKQRGMLKDTLLVWGGEFGRGAHIDNAGGRGHNGKGFTMWLAGGGVKGGFRHGKTNEMGDTAVEGLMDFHDLHATILHLLGLDHRKLTFRYGGRDFRLTDTKGNVARDILS